MVMKMMSALKHPSLAAMLFFVLFSFFKLSCSIGNICPDLEKQALLSFKQSLYDPNNKLSSWNDDEVNCCEWKGVLCSNLTGHVQQLDLQMSFLSGKVSPSLLNLNYLKYLDLSGNNFNETIPPFIGSLTSLEYLDLSYAEFHGKIPHTIGNLSNLHNLILESNFSLEVVSLEWMARLSKIEYLNMNGVDLSRASDWQHVINKLPSLVELHLSGCNLNFTSPLSDVSNNITTSNLAILDLSAWNAPFQLTSASILPKWIFRLGNLTYLDLSAIMFEGPIPTVSNTTKLKHINLSNNNFNSSIPGWLYFLKDLEYLNLLSNNLQDAISNSVANLTSLSTLDLSANEIYGEIPRGLFKNLCELSDLDLSQNYKLQGGVSDLFGNASDCFLESLESLYLNGNQFSGPLANPFAEFKRLRILDLSKNSLSGVIPSNIGNLSSSLEQIDLSDNKFRGNLPETICQLSNLQYLKIDNNMLEGVVTETHFSLLSRLDTLSASGNNLTLKVNPNWIPPFKLFALRMGSWNLGSPIIPPWLDTQKTSIEHLDLSNTGIYGNVPNWLWSMKFLNISHNQLHGSIWVISDPWPTITTMYQFLYFGSNKFSGSLPLVGKYLVDLDLSNNSFSGDLSHFLCTRSTYRLENLQLEGNQLTGELPNCFTKWPYLRMLNLGSNNFSGRIPYSVGFLTSLKSLNLQRNNFSGSIPFSMHTCTELLKIDLSDNNLSGNLSKQIVTSLSKLVILILKSNKLSGEITSAICQLSSLQILDPKGDNKSSGIENT